MQRQRVYEPKASNRFLAAGNRMICDTVNQDRRSVLVVEDDDMLGQAIGLCVEEAGYEVAGVAQSVDDALTTLSDRPVHAALLDVNLRGELVFAVADALAARGVPFVFVTGQPASSIPETHRHRPLVPKPYYDAALCAALASVLGSRCR
jgi:CheY-like chemotaxis protein